MIDYRCSSCGACQVKLWRPPHLENPLTCRSCSESSEGAPHYGGVRCDVGWMIGNLLPAVLTPGFDNFFNVEGTSRHAKGWWRYLPESHEHRRRTKPVIGCTTPAQARRLAESAFKDGPAPDVTALAHALLLALDDIAARESMDESKPGDVIG